MTNKSTKNTFAKHKPKLQQKVNVAISLEKRINNKLERIIHETKRGLNIWKKIYGFKINKSVLINQILAQHFELDKKHPQTQDEETEGN